MQERVFMGIGNKPFMDIQPSDAAISNRAVNCVLIGRGTPALQDLIHQFGGLSLFLLFAQFLQTSSCSALQDHHVVWRMGFLEFGPSLLAQEAVLRPLLPLDLVLCPL